MGGGGRGTFFEDLPLVEFMYLLFTRLPGESYLRPFMSQLLCPLFFERYNKMKRGTVPCERNKQIDKDILKGIRLVCVLVTYLKLDGLCPVKNVTY